MNADESWEKLLCKATLYPIEIKEEPEIKIKEWKRIEADPLPSVRALGIFESLKRWREDRLK